MKKEIHYDGYDPTLKDWLRIIINELEDIAEAYRVPRYHDEWKATAFAIFTEQLRRIIEKLEHIEPGGPDCDPDLPATIAEINVALEKDIVGGAHSRRVRQMSEWIASVAGAAHASGAPAVAEELEDISNDLLSVPPPRYECVPEGESEAERRQRQLTDALAYAFRYWRRRPAAELVHAVVEAVDGLRPELEAIDEDESQKD